MKKIYQLHLKILVSKTLQFTECLFYIREDACYLNKTQGLAKSHFMSQLMTQNLLVRTFPQLPVTGTEDWQNYSFYRGGGAHAARSTT